MVKLNLAKESDIDTATPVSSIPATSRRNKSRKSFMKFINLVLLVSVIFLGYLYYQKKNELQFIKDPRAQAELAKKEAEEIVKKLEKIVVLPATDELPELLTINDATLAIKEQPNLEGVVNGDKILLYAKVGKAYIYSPSRNIIVNILPVALQRPQIQPTVQQPATQPKASTSTTTKAPAETKQDNS